MSGQDIVTAVGMFIELVGVALTGWGLRRTWSDNARGQRFGSALRAELRGLLPRRPRHIEIHVTDVMAIGSTAAAAVVTASPSPDLTVEERLEHLEARIVETTAEAASAKARVEVLEQRVTDTHDRLEQRISSVQETADTQVRRHTLDGLPTAVFGLLLTGVGTVIQLVAVCLN